MLGKMVLLGATILSAAPAFAQDQGEGLEDIVITAERRETRLQQTPIAVTALTASALSDRSASRIEDLAGALPNVYIDQRSLRGQTIAIRGLSADLNNPGLDQSVGIYVDGVYLGRATPGNASLFDLERVEVLRGPQGALYGKNTIAGAINYISKLPGDELRATFEGGYGNYDAWSLRGVVSGPVAGEKIAASISASVDQRDGLFTNLATGTRLDDLDSLAARGTLVLRPAEDVEIVLRGDIGRDRAYAVGIDILDNGAFTGAPFADADPTDRAVTQDFDSFTRRDVWGVSGDINWKLGDGTLTSITALRGFEWSNDSDNDYSVLFMLNSGIKEDQRQFSQELRYAGTAGALDYVLGGYYFHQTLNTDAVSTVGPDLGIYPDPVEGIIFGDVKTESVAVFAHGEYAFTDQLSLSAGLRYTDENKTLDHAQQGDPFEILLPNYAERRIKRSEDNFSPSASLNFKPSDDLLLYASYARGFKSGGFNVFSITPTNDARYEPENVDNYEIGLKSSFWDKRGRFNVAIFRMDYANLQVNQLILVGGIPRFQTSNAAEARSKGLEAEFALRPVPGLDLAVNYAYLDAEFRDYRNATSAGADYTGNRLPLAPKHSGSVSAQYDGPITEDWNVFARAELVARSRVWFAADNAFAQDSVGLLNGRIGVHNPDGGWGVYVWGRNLTDKTYAIDRGSGAIVPGQVTQVLGNPRMYGIEVKLAF